VLDILLVLGKKKNVYESFLKFTEVTSLTGDNLAAAILNGN
jgi:hypothetical protein